MKHPIPPSARDQRLGAKKMRLPFEPRTKRSGLSAWIYRHRVGLLVTVVIYLSAIILFLSYRIILNPAPAPMISMEFEQEPPIVEQPKPEEQNPVEQIDMPSDQKMRNRISDANSNLDASIRDSKRSDASKIYEEAERVKSQMLSGADAYQRALREIEQSGRKPEKQSNDRRGAEGQKAQTANYKGSVSVEWDLPDRTDVYMHVPAYQCQNAGMVVVAIVVNRNGRVIQASVDKITSSDDPCIGDMAVKAAMASSFNASASAPERQRGTITYTFKAQ